jgi:hypothetical protein
MRRKYRDLLFFPALAVLFLFTSGCGFTNSIINKVIPSEPAPRKRVMVIAFMDNADLEPDKRTTLAARFIEKLQNSSRLMLDPDPVEMSWPAASKSPELGIVIPEEQIKEAAREGMHALISGVLNPIETYTQKSGFWPPWPFRRLHRFYEVSLVINVLDIPTRTLLYSRLEAEKASFPLEESGGLQGKQRPAAMLQAQLREVLKRQIEAVRETLEQHPWTGRIAAVEDESIRIEAGKNIGLSTGQRFQVLAEGERIQAQSGQQVYLAGKQIGTIELFSVSEKRSLGRVVEGGPCAAGQIVRYKH